MVQGKTRKKRPHGTEGHTYVEGAFNQTLNSLSVFDFFILWDLAGSGWIASALRWTAEWPTGFRLQTLHLIMGCMDAVNSWLTQHVNICYYGQGQIRHTFFFRSKILHICCTQLLPRLCQCQWNDSQSSLSNSSEFNLAAKFIFVNWLHKND